MTELSVIDKTFLKTLIQRAGPLVGFGLLAFNFGITLIIEPTFESWRFGRIDFGGYAYLVGGAFCALGVFSFIGGIVNTVKVLKQGREVSGSDPDQ